MKMVIIIFLFITLLLSSDNLDAKKFCNEIIVKKDFTKLTYTLSGLKIINFADGAFSTVTSLNAKKGFLFIGNKQLISLIIEACDRTNKLIAQSRFNYFTLLELQILVTAKKSLKDRLSK